MDDLLTFFLILLFSTIRLATPLLFAALGGLFRSVRALSISHLRVCCSRGRSRRRW